MIERYASIARDLRAYLTVVPHDEGTWLSRPDLHALIWWRLIIRDGGRRAEHARETEAIYATLTTAYNHAGERIDLCRGCQQYHTAPLKQIVSQPLSWPTTYLPCRRPRTRSNEPYSLSEKW